MKLRPLVLAISIATVNVNSVYSNTQCDHTTTDEKSVSYTASDVLKTISETTVLPNLNSRINQILIDHFKSIGISDPGNIIVTVGVMKEADIAVPTNTALLSADWLGRQVRPTTFEWSRMPLLELAKLRAFGSSAPANRSFLAGAHRVGQPAFPIPSGGPDSVLLDKEGNRIVGHAEWPDTNTIEQAVKGTMAINIEDHSLIDFSKIRWKQRYGLPKGVPPYSYIKWVEHSGTIEEERQRAKSGSGKIVDDTSDVKICHVNHPTIPVSKEASKAFLRVLKGDDLDVSDWAYMITAWVRAESTKMLEQSFNDQLLYTAQLAYRSQNVNAEAGELTLEEVSVIEKFLEGDKNVVAHVPHLPAKGYVPFNLNGVKSTGHVPAITSKNHALIVDDTTGIYIWHFTGGPKNGVRGGFATKEEAITWYRNWLTNKGGRTGPNNKGEVYPYYNSNFEQHLVLDESGWWTLKSKFNYDLSHWRREKAEQLTLLLVGGDTYGLAMADQYFKAARADIDSQFKQRNEQFAEDLRYWFEFAANTVAILGVGTSGKFAKLLDFVVITGGIGVGGVTIANADNPSETLEGIGAIIEATADTLESTGVGDRLSRKSSAISHLFRGGSAENRQRIAQKAEVNQPTPVVLESKVSDNLQSGLNQIWSSPQADTAHNAKKLHITKENKQLEVILHQGKAYARYQNGYWFVFKLDLTSLDSEGPQTSTVNSHISYDSISLQAQERYGNKVKVVKRKPDLEIISSIEIYFDINTNKLALYIPDQDHPIVISSIEDAEPHINNYIQRQETRRQQINQLNNFRQEVRQHLGNDVVVLSQQPGSVDYEARILVWPSTEESNTYKLYIPGEGSNFKTFSQLTEAKSLLANYRKNEYTFNASWFLGDKVKVIDDVSQREVSQYTIFFDADSPDQITLYTPNSETPLSFSSFEEVRSHLVKNNVVGRIKVNDDFLSADDINSLKQQYNINISRLKLSGQEIALAYHKASTISDTFVLLAHGSGKEAIMFIKPEGLALDFATPSNTILQSGGLGDNVFDLLNKLKDNKVRFKHESQVYDVSQIKMKDYSLSSSAEMESHEAIARYISRQTITDSSTSGVNNNFTIININENALGLRLSDVIDALKETYGPNTPTKMVCHFCRGEDNDAEIFDIKNNYVK
ncbi:hypothetical protein [Spartinivicinus poritis]|uniref:Uncharacterized protein n=1 Tax=Spartinivicinus poritis TaxID=2994640 RepID=A0ABT5U8R5_9GAMM|nr:hypothetical protein [Spartinivicinus sp. A2-2]MDE1462745.1 hypothetical protein [Spartinivicinus sp. A2-2]